MEISGGERAIGLSVGAIAGEARCSVPGHGTHEAGPWIVKDADLGLHAVLDSRGLGSRMDGYAGPVDVGQAEGGGASLGGDRGLEACGPCAAMGEGVQAGTIVAVGLAGVPTHEAGAGISAGVAEVVMAGWAPRTWIAGPEVVMSARGAGECGVCGAADGGDRAHCGMSALWGSSGSSAHSASSSCLVAGPAGQSTGAVGCSLGGLGVGRGAEVVSGGVGACGAGNPSASPVSAWVSGESVCVVGKVLLPVLGSLVVLLVVSLVLQLVHKLSGMASVSRSSAAGAVLAVACLGLGISVVASFFALFVFMSDFPISVLGPCGGLVMADGADVCV